MVSENSVGGDSRNAAADGNARFTEMLLCARYSLRVSLLALSHLIFMAAQEADCFIIFTVKMLSSLNSEVAEAQLRLVF